MSRSPDFFKKKKKRKKEKSIHIHIHVLKMPSKKI